MSRQHPQSNWRHMIQSIGKTKPLFDHLLANGFTRTMPNGLYLIQVDGGRVKIGRSNSPLLRWVSIISSWPAMFPLRVVAVIPDAQELELQVHAKFNECRAWGEWFNYSPRMEELAAIKSVDELKDWLAK